MRDDEARSRYISIPRQMKGVYMRILFNRGPLSLVLTFAMIKGSEMTRLLFLMSICLAAGPLADLSSTQPDRMPPM
jgi:hypothetical protein